MALRLNLDAARDWADLTLKIMSALAIAAGGVWAYFQWRVTDAAETGAQISTSAEVLPYRQGLCLVVIHAKPKNVGRVPISAGRNGLSVTLQELPASLPPGAVNPNELKLRHAPVDVIAAWRNEGYVIEPGVEYDELQTEVAPIGSIFLARAELDVGDGTEVDQSTVVRADCISAALTPAATASAAVATVAVLAPSAVAPASPSQSGKRLASHPVDDRERELTGSEFWPAIGGYRFKVTDTLLVLFTAALWFATRRLVQGADKTAEKQLRSYVFVNVHLDQRILWTPSGDARSPIVVRFANHGSTPAQLTRIRATAQVLPSAPTKLPDAMEVDVPSGIGLGPQVADTVPVHVKGSVEDLKAIELDDQALYCFGCIEYEDVLGTRRETSFCWSLSIRGEHQVFTITPDTPLNHRN